VNSFRKFEIDVISILGEEYLSATQMGFLSSYCGDLNYSYTGAGYYLTLNHASLPNKDASVSSPNVMGESGNYVAGFLLFLGGNELTLECHTWGPLDVPCNFRDLPIKVSVLNTH